MRNVSSYNSNLGTAILLVGGAGSGKTSTGLRLFRKTYVLVADPNFASGLRYIESLKKSDNVVGYDNALLDSNDKPIAANQRYDHCFRCLSEAAKDPNVDAIFIDSATFMEDIIKAKICGAAKDEQIKLSNYDQWGALMLTWKSLIMQLRSTGKKLLMACHEKKDKDESDGIWKSQIAVDGQIREKFPALFSDVWRLQVKETGGKHFWQCQTLGNVRQDFLKNTYGFPGEMPVDQVIEQVQKVTYPV